MRTEKFPNMAKFAKDKLWRFIHNAAYGAVVHSMQMANSDVEGVFWRRAAEETADFVTRSNIPLHLGYPDRYAMMGACLRQMPSTGLIMELGVYKGESIRRIAGQIGDRRVYGFDSFEGLKEPWITGK